MELTILLHLVTKVKNEWSCTSAPPLCLHGMDKTAFLNTGFHSGRLQSAMFVAMMQECLKVSHYGVTTGKERKSGLNLQ